MLVVFPKTGKKSFFICCQKHRYCAQRGEKRARFTSDFIHVWASHTDGTTRLRGSGTLKRFETRSFVLSSLAWWPGARRVAWQTSLCVLCKRRARILGPAEWRLRRALRRCGKLRLMASRSAWTDESESRQGSSEAAGNLIGQRCIIDGAGSPTCWRSGWHPPGMGSCSAQLAASGGAADLLSDLAKRGYTGGAGVIFKLSLPCFCSLLHSWAKKKMERHCKLTSCSHCYT